MSASNDSPFVVTGAIKRIIESLDDIRRGGYLKEGDTNVLITGESGSGKSELMKRYADRFPLQCREEYTYIPVVYVKLRSPTSAKAFAQQILVSMHDPQNGGGIKSREEGYRRIKLFCETCKVEMFILDELQTLIQNRSAGVISSISDWVKDLMNDTSVPVVMVGMPWCLDFVQGNDQLDTRVSYRFHLDTYYVSRLFSQFVKFIDLYSRDMDFSDGFKITDKEVAYRLFAYSSGVTRAITGIISKADRVARKEGKAMDLSCFQEVVRSQGVPDSGNAFLVPVQDLRLSELVRSSQWVAEKSYRKDKFKGAVFKTYRLNNNLELIECDVR